jgi:hypothetical protein
MTLMIGLGTYFFLEMSKKCWPRFRVWNSTITIIKFWTSNFCHIEKITLNHALLKLSHER